MKVPVSVDERWPFFSIEQWSSYEVDIPANMAKRWARVMKEFEEVQDQMKIEIKAQLGLEYP